jgi:hypothetical protein
MIGWTSSNIETQIGLEKSDNRPLGRLRNWKIMFKVNVREIGLWNESWMKLAQVHVQILASALAVSKISVSTAIILV